MPFTIKTVLARVDFTINFDDGPNPPSKSDCGYDITAESVNAADDRLVIELYDTNEDKRGMACFMIDTTAPSGEQLVLDDTYTDADFVSNAVESLNDDLRDATGKPIQIPRSAWRLYLHLDVFREEPLWFVSTINGLDVYCTPLDTHIQDEDGLFVKLDPIVKIIDVRSCTVTDLL
ncbi:MAG: hypothetical protein JWM07_814 [Candidatus Saccharibacteria bacterium]|nr:hypothetical protein [Candidatus Saccharibacteria bacterium]